MSGRLRHVDPARRPGAVRRAFAAFSATRPGRLVSSRIGWRIDPFLLRATGGRVSTGILLPVALLETTGARSGTPRANAVLYFHDGDRVIVVASKAGFERHPAWFHNLRARPDVRLGGIPMRASVVDDEAERERLWTLADRVFAPYEQYRREAARAGRTIPLVELRTQTGSDPF